MSSDHSKLRQQHRTEQAARLEERQQPALEFDTVDDLLRYDSAQNPAPPEIAERLNSSISAEPRIEKGWFRKIFGG